MPANPFAQELKLVQQSESPEVLFSRLASLKCERRELVRALVITSQHSVPDLLASASGSGYEVSRLAVAQRLSHFRLSHRQGRSGSHSQSGILSIVDVEIPYVYLVLTVSDWPLWNRGVIPFVQKLYPNAARVFLSQEELHRLAKGAKEIEKNVSIRILRTSARRRLRAGGARRRFETDITWTDRPLEVVFRQASEENVWFKSITFELGRLEGSTFESKGVEASISKYGSLFCNSYFGGFLRKVILPMAEIASQKFSFFMGRERRKTPDLLPRPVVISFPTDVFRSADDSKRFISVLARMPNVSCSVLHGNPYVHVSFVDNLDGSSTRVWVVKPNELTIVPQIKTSEAALKRIVNHVFEEWAEGEITEARG